MSTHRLLAGKSALVTGGASGIGEAIAKLFVRSGAKVLIADIQDDLGSRLASSLGPSALFASCDVAKESSVQSAVDAAMTQFGKLDIMVANAGVVGRGQGVPVQGMDMEDFGRVMAVNALGTAHAIKHGARAMLEGKVRGSIICMSSIASAMAGMSPPAYTASKHAIVGLVKAAASDLGKHGIRVNSISPFGVHTPMVTEFFKMTAEGFEEFRDRRTNLKGTFRADDIAQAALFLSSMESSGYISGHNLILDGGFHVTTHAFEVQT